MAKAKRRPVLPTGALFSLLLGAVIFPAVLSVAVGIVALALWREAFDIVFGVLVLCFAAMAIAGGILAIAFVRRSARLAELQTDFIASVSHELRTPVAGIQLLVETLQMGRAEEPERREEVLELLMNDVTRLDDLVGRILTWRRLEAGMPMFQPGPQPLAEVLEEAIAAVRKHTDELQASVNVHVQGDVPPVYADRDALVDAMRNLLENAVKFGGDRGPVEIVARHAAPDVVIEVRDRGPGIPVGDRKRIFDRFYRVPVHPRSRQGTGLGLAIVRSVIEGHRGRIQVESEPGIGSTFIVRLPATPPEGGEAGGG